MPRKPSGSPLELAPVSYSHPDRPATIECDGGTIYLHIHDGEYMRQRSAFRRRLANAHPDRGGNAAHFRQIMRARQSWLCSEVIWYARLGLFPPDGNGKSYAGSTAERIRLQATQRDRKHTPALSGRQRGRKERK